VLGGWSFSDGTHRWPVSDCTAEALSAVLLVHRRADLHECASPRVPQARLYEAVEFICSRQNADGGFGTYERTRGPAWLEKLNPTEMYAGCMTDFSCPEPTASCVSALARFRHDHPGYQPRRVDSAIRGGVRYLRSCQRPDGSYRGSWGINFTYAAFFVTEALLAAGVPPADPAVADAVGWLCRHQKSDGGWGEHYGSCLTGRYTEHPDSQAAMTAWALLVLLGAAGPDDPDAVRALRCLETMQRRHRRRVAPPGSQRRLLPDRRPGLPPLQRHLPHLGPRALLPTRSVSSSLQASRSPRQSHHRLPNRKRRSACPPSDDSACLLMRCWVPQRTQISPICM
jgi:squalene cyclase